VKAWAVGGVISLTVWLAVATIAALNMADPLTVTTDVKPDQPLNAGEYLVVERSVNSRSKATVDIQRWIESSEDGLVYNLRNSSASFDVGTTSRAFTIKTPQTLPSGNYTYHAVLTYNSFMFLHHTLVTEPMRFSIE